MGRGVGQGLDDLELLDDRAGPPVRDDERQRVLVLRARVDEMKVEPIDLRHELRQRVQSCLALAPLVLRRPVARESLHRPELHALRCIRDVFPLWPLRRLDAPAHFGQIGFRSRETKLTNFGLPTARLLRDVSHGVCPPVEEVEKIERPRGDACRCSTEKATTIEAGSL
jgi:hypothetical protein